MKHIKVFWEGVQKTGTCWLWTRVKNHLGYGRFGGGKNRQYTHRISWELHFGKIPDGKCVLHRCDNPSCCNPNHLFLGTRTENIADMIKKGRQAVGRQRPVAKLTEEIVKQMRNLYSTGQWSQSDLGKRFGISQSSVGDVVKRVTWKHIKESL